MSDTVTDLLRRAAESVDPPPPDARAVIARSRRTRKRRSLTRGIVAAAAVGLVAAAIGAGLTARHGTPAAAQERFENAAADAAYRRYGAFAAGRVVHIGNHRVTLKSRVTSLLYTSEGALARETEASNSGASAYALVRPDGTSRALRLPADRIVGTDPDSPYAAWTEGPRRTGDRWAFVVIDVRSGREIARKSFRSRFTWASWGAPPVTTAGHRAWARVDSGWLGYDWLTGALRFVPGSMSSEPTAAHGRFLMQEEWDAPPVDVRELSTGRTLRKAPASNWTVNSLSPDGRFLSIGSRVHKGERPMVVHSTALDIATGRTVTLPGAASWGWTPDGRALSVDAAADVVTVCDAASARCDRIRVEIGAGRVALGGAAQGG